MSILHQNLLIVTFYVLPLALKVLEQVIYDYLVRKYQKHWLVQLKHALELRPLEKGCTAYHQGNGKGSAVTHPVPKLVRALLVKYLLNLSYRQTEETIDRDLLIKWFVGYGLFDNPPDHTTLQRFEIWVLNHQPQLFFVKTLSQIKAADPQDWQQDLQIVDTFAMLARAAKGRLIPLIRQVCQRILGQLETASPERQQLILSLIDPLALFGQPDEKPTRALKAEERAERLQQVVIQALALHKLLKASLAQAPLGGTAHWQLEQDLALLHKIIFDETEVTPVDPAAPEPLSADTQEIIPPPASLETPPPPLQVVERPNGKKGLYRVVSLTDQEATFRHHGADKGEAARIAYNNSALTGTIYIHWYQADTGARPDKEPLPEMLRDQFDCFGFFPGKVVADQIYGYGQVRATVDRLTGGQTQLVALLPNTLVDQGRYGPLDFYFDPAHLTLTCPNNRVSAKFTDKPQDGGRTFRFTYKMCQGCPLLEQCRSPQASPKSRRSIFVSYYRDYNLAALAYNKTEKFKQDIKQRPLIERIIFNLTHYHGARQAKSTGLEKADFQLGMACTVFNIRQFLRRWSKFKPLSAAA